LNGSELANQNRELIKSKISKLGSYGVDFNLAYDPKFNKLMYDKSKINDIYGKNIESTNELRKSAEELFNKIESLNNENKSLGSNWFSTDKEIVSSTKEVRDLLKKINDEAAKAIQDDASKRLETYEDAQDKIVGMLKKKYEQQKKDEERYKRATQVVMAYSDSVGTIFGGMITGNKNAAKQGMKQIISMALNQLKAYALAQLGIATIGSFATPDSILSFGATGATRAIILGGLITAAASACDPSVDVHATCELTDWHP
jgi:hypothetical protein